MSLPEPLSSIAHYDEIPSFCIGDRILDVGSSDGYGAAHSKHRDIFFDREYLGLDIQRFEGIYLPIIQGDIFKFETDCKFDTILLLHALEHFPLDRWEVLFRKLDSLLVPGGFLVVNVPFNQPAYLDSEERDPMFHEVGMITESLLLQYWQFQSFSRVGNRSGQLILRNKGESWFRILGRAVKRLFTNHKYSMVRIYINSKRPARLVAIYEKV